MPFSAQCHTSYLQSNWAFLSRVVRKRRATPYTNLSVAKSNHTTHKVIEKLDMNAFNSLRRDHILQTCLDRTSEVAKLALLAYRKFSSVIASGLTIASSSGVQQGALIDPLLIALAVDQSASGVQSELSV